MQNQLFKKQQAVRLQPGRFIDQVYHYKVRMLTWKQPFGFLMLHNKIETRVWDTHYRGWVLIHAAQKDYDKSQILGISGEDNYNRIQELSKDVGPELYRSRGKAIAIGYLERTFPMFLATPKEMDQTFVKYHNDLYCHEFSEVHPIKPFYMKGKQGWSTLFAEDISKIEICKTFMDR